MVNPKLPLVLVTWNDANTGNDDAVTVENVAAYHKPTIVRTLGWLLKEDEKGITLVNEYYDEVYRGRTFIYRPMIISINPFNLSKPRQVKKARHAKNPTNPPHTTPATLTGISAEPVDAHRLDRP